MYDHLLLTEKSQSGQFGSGQTLQQTPKIPGSAEIMRSCSTEPIVAYSLLRYLQILHDYLFLILAILLLKVVFFSLFLLLGAILQFLSGKMGISVAKIT